MLFNKILKYLMKKCFYWNQLVAYSLLYLRKKYIIGSFAALIIDGRSCIERSIFCGLRRITVTTYIFNRITILKCCLSTRLLNRKFWKISLYCDMTYYCNFILWKLNWFWISIIRHETKAIMQWMRTYYPTTFWCIFYFLIYLNNFPSSAFSSLPGLINRSIQNSK